MKTTWMLAGCLLLSACTCASAKTATPAATQAKADAAIAKAAATAMKKAVANANKVARLEAKAEIAQIKTGQRAQIAYYKALAAAAKYQTDVKYLTTVYGSGMQILQQTGSVVVLKDSTGGIVMTSVP